MNSDLRRYALDMAVKLAFAEGRQPPYNEMLNEAEKIYKWLDSGFRTVSGR
jgi:hypothetical protein